MHSLISSTDQGLGNPMYRLIALALCLQACTTYTDDGELVRHHLGYVRVISPSVYSPEGPVQAVAVSNYGLWLDVDRRKSNQRTGSGAGIGYRANYQNILPESCRIIFRVATKEQFDASVALLDSLIKDGGEDLCVIQEG